VNLRTVLEHKSVAVVAGSGGVGKTTMSAAIALQAALHTNKRVLVITVDPARRLADALGVACLGDEPVRIDLSTLDVEGELWAAMLDTKKAWDELVRRHAPDASTRDAILSNKLYENISGRFVQSHDYIAMERLYELHELGEYDLIVVDTPPSAHASDLLDAPQRLADFFDSRLLKFLVAPSRSRLANLTAKPFLQLADRLLGKRFLSDISEFFTLLESMRPGFISRANRVDELLASDECSFAVVTTLEPSAVHEARGLIDELVKRELDLGAVVANRVLPESLRTPIVVDSGEFEGAALESTPTESQNPAAVQRVVTELHENATRFGHLARQQAQQLTELSERAKILGTIPWTSGELRSLHGLTVLGEKIW
jgi:anion-transporting  ArsA/GET3 family ATPase